jgi:hypothetical protein
VNTLYGLNVVTDQNMVEKVWVFPQDKFVEYEPKDEWWCRKYGFGHEETRPQQQVVRVGDTLVMHPATLDLLVKDMDEQYRRAFAAVKAMTEQRMKEVCELPEPGPKKAFITGVTTSDVLKVAHDFKKEWGLERLDIFTKPLRDECFPLPMTQPKVEFRPFRYAADFKPMMPPLLMTPLSA